MFNKTYQIILLSYPDGERLTDYYSTIVPMVNDCVIDDDEDPNVEYQVIERHFSIRNEKVVLLVELVDSNFYELDEKPTFSDENLH
jgi:hypothetical protein